MALINVKIMVANRISGNVAWRIEEKVSSYSCLYNVALGENGLGNVVA